MPTDCSIASLWQSWVWYVPPLLAAVQIDLASQVVIVLTKLTVKNNGKAGLNSVEICHLDSQMQHAASIEVPQPHTLPPSLDQRLQSSQYLARWDHDAGVGTMVPYTSNSVHIA